MTSQRITQRVLSNGLCDTTTNSTRPKAETARFAQRPSFCSAGHSSSTTALVVWRLSFALLRPSSASSFVWVLQRQSLMFGPRCWLRQRVWQSCIVIWLSRHRLLRRLRTMKIPSWRNNSTTLPSMIWSTMVSGFDIDIDTTRIPMVWFLCSLRSLSSSPPLFSFSFLTFLSSPSLSSLLLSPLDFFSSHTLTSYGQELIAIHGIWKSSVPPLQCPYSWSTKNTRLKKISFVYFESCSATQSPPLNRFWASVRSPHSFPLSNPQKHFAEDLWRPRKDSVIFGSMLLNSSGTSSCSFVPWKPLLNSAQLQLSDLPSYKWRNALSALKLSQGIFIFC